jgi:hypothetical protein
MSMSWRDRLQEIRERFLGNQVSSDAGTPIAATTSVARESAKEFAAAAAPTPRIVAINLGIDFGTSFTKVCYRDVGTEESGVVAIGEGLKHALLPSVVLVGAGGRLSLSDGPSYPDCIAVTYLKMRLAGTPIEDDLTEVAGAKLDDVKTIKALAAWFLASVIARSQQWMSLNEASRLKNRTPVWSANVGVPVEHYDSAALATFEEVLGVAWTWVKDRKIPQTLESALHDYSAAVPRLTHEVADFNAIPEIAAAVQSFVMSREAVPGIYIYFDIGGGTVDGVAFDYLNHNGERRINFYSGKVEALGISAIGTALKRNQQGEFDAGLLEALLKNCPRNIRKDYENRVRCLVGNVVMTAKKKDGRDWQVDAIQRYGFERRFIGRLSPDRMKPLIVFLGGGGSISQWYGSTIGSTYAEFQQERAGVPPYKLLKVQSPKDLTLKEGADFTRFAVSYGLSIPFGEGPEVRLPSQFAKAEQPKPWSPPGLVNYADSKDVYD